MRAVHSHKIWKNLGNHLSHQVEIFLPEKFHIDAVEFAQLAESQLGGGDVHHGEVAVERLGDAFVFQYGGYFKLPFLPVDQETDAVPRLKTRSGNEFFRQDDAPGVHDDGEQTFQVGLYRFQREIPDAAVL